MEKSIRKYWPLFVLPTMLAFAIGFLIPFVMGLYLSFCEFTTVADAQFIGLANYIKIFTIIVAVLAVAQMQLTNKKEVQR